MRDYILRETLGTKYLDCISPVAGTNPSENVYAINDIEDYEFNLKHFVKTGILAMANTNDYPRFDLLLMGIRPNNVSIDARQPWQ
jgi:hypothetical protein